MKIPKLKIKKWNGDDSYSWAIFRSDQVDPIVSGLTKREASYHVEKIKKSLEKKGDLKMNSNEFYTMIDSASADLHSGCSSNEEFEGCVPDMADGILSEDRVKKFLVKELEITDEIEQKEFIMDLL